MPSFYFMKTKKFRAHKESLKNKKYWKNKKPKQKKI